MAVLFDRKDPQKTGLDLRWGLSLLLADASQAESESFVSTHQDVLNSQEENTLILTDMDDFYATFGSSWWGSDSNWTYSHIYSTAQRFFSDAQKVQSVGGDLFVDLKPAPAGLFMGCAGPSEGVDWFIGTNTTSADAFTKNLLVALSSQLPISEQLTGIKKEKLDGRFDVDAAKIPYEKFGDQFTGDDILTFCRNLKGLPQDVVQKMISKFGQYAVSSAIEYTQNLKTNSDWLASVMPTASHDDCATLAFAYLNYPVADTLQVGQALLAQGYQIQEGLQVLAGFTPADTVRILTDAKNNKEKYLTKWTTYTGWQKGLPKNALTNMPAGCPITDTISDHYKFIKDELFGKIDKSLSQAFTPEFILTKIAIESEGLSQCNEDGLMQVSDDDVFNHYYDKYMPKDGKDLNHDGRIDKGEWVYRYPRDRNDYRTNILVAAFFLRDECFNPRYNPCQSEGVGMACYNRRPSRMKTYAESNGVGSPLPDTTIAYIAKSLVIRKAAEAYTQNL